jgi:hypothetical protein
MSKTRLRPNWGNIWAVIGFSATAVIVCAAFYYGWPVS